MLSLLYAHYTSTFLFIIIRSAVSQHVKANKPSAREKRTHIHTSNISVNDIVPKINTGNLLSTIFIRIIIISFSASDIYLSNFRAYFDKLCCVVSKELL